MITFFKHMLTLLFLLFIGYVSFVGAAAFIVWDINVYDIGKWEIPGRILFLCWEIIMFFIWCNITKSVEDEDDEDDERYIYNSRLACDVEKLAEAEFGCTPRD